MKQRLSRTHFLPILFASVIWLASFDNASAATFYMVSDKDSAVIGDTLKVSLKMDSEGAGINAAQAVLQFPKDILEATGISKDGSVFNFWLEEPSFSNDGGSVTFIGGSSSGIAGKSLHVVDVSFRVKGAGRATFVFTDGAITASDGSGTNVLSVMRGLEVESVSRQELVPTTPQIVRSAVPSARLPAKAIIAIPSYPDPAQWYNNVSNFLVSWDLSADVSDVSTALNRNISYSAVKSEGLFDSKIFPAITQDGVWYVHAQFKNNIGWGPVANYRIAIDTEPPLPFEIKALEGETTDNPAPILEFHTHDTLSDLKEYQVRIGDGDLIVIPAKDFSGIFTLPLQTPGVRNVAVKAIDLADNGIGDDIVLDILPISSPVITFVTTELFLEEARGLTVKGTALPNINILLQVRQTLDGKGEVAAKGAAQADDKGNWEFTFDEPLRNGNYVVLVHSQDARGALSLEIASSEIQVKSKPIIQIGIFQLGRGGALILLVIIIFAGFGGGVWFYKNRQKKIALRTLAAENDLAKVFKMISDDVDKLAKFYQTDNPANIKFMLDKLQENTKKMEGYLKAGIDRIKDLF
ncbi:MAG: hypothetical protein AAB378_01105 [Patescibacteria group bacterium]